MHASGTPGSHVVIHCTADKLPAGTLKDAAVLAAKYSKATSSRVPVTITRAGNVSKPKGSKPGLVSLSGEIHSRTVSISEEASRLQRLEDGAHVNTHPGDIEASPVK